MFIIINKKTLTGSKKVILNTFVYSYLLCYLILIVIPADAIKPNKGFNFLLNMVFLILIICTSITIYKVFPRKKIKSTSNLSEKKMPYKKLIFIIKVSSISSILGLILVFYDRVFIREINYMLGLRAARYQWMDSAQMGMGGSLQSTIGNLLIPLAYISILVAFIHYEDISKPNRNLAFFSGIFVAFGHAALNGGRSNIFILIILLLTISVLRKSVNKSYFPKRNKMFAKGILLFLIAIIFTLQISASSSKMSNINFETQARLGISALHGKTNNRFEKIGLISDYEYLFVLLLAYLGHGQWVAQETLYLDNRYGEFTFVGYKQILYQLGILNFPPVPNYFSESGTFISLPGVLFYDFGFSGVIMASIFIGLLLGVVLLLLSVRCVINGTKMAFIIYVLVSLYLSPILPAHGFVYFNSVIVAFIYMDILTRFIFGNSSWLYLEEFNQQKKKK